MKSPPLLATILGTVKEKSPSCLDVLQPKDVWILKKCSSIWLIFFNQMYHLLHPDDFSHRVCISRQRHRLLGNQKCSNFMMSKLNEMFKLLPTTSSTMRPQYCYHHIVSKMKYASRACSDRKPSLGMLCQDRFYQETSINRKQGQSKCQPRQLEM